MVSFYLANVTKNKLKIDTRSLFQTGSSLQVDGTPRKCYSENVPISLPLGHSIRAFSESHVHHELRTNADESVISLYHMMKSLLVRVTQGNPLDKRPSGNLNRRSGTVVPGYESSSGEDSTVSETYGYTSGALNSNEDLRNLYTSSEGYPATVSA